MDQNPNENNIKKEQTDFDKHILVLSKKIKSYLVDKESDTLIIKGHLLCEYYFNQILIILKQTDFDNLSWAQKNEKINTLGILKKEIYKKFCELNKLRNKLGHELEYKINESDIDKIGFIFGEQYILDKYDIDDEKKLLEKYISSIVVHAAITLLIEVEKIKNKKAS